MVLFKKALSYLLHNSYISFAGYILKQTRGIPMGGGSSAPIADLYLCVKEFIYMNNLLKAKRFNLAKRLSLNSRYIDDVNVTNSKDFLNKAQDIYPPELLLDRNGQDDKNAVYLDIRIQIYEDSIHTNIFNKTDDFNFPVVSFTFPESCVPVKLGYQVFYGQVLRYSFICSNKEFFISHSRKLLNVLLKRGYKKQLLLKYFCKCINKYNFIIFKFGFNDARNAMDELSLVN